MFESLDNVDWNLLHQQKLLLLEMLERLSDGSPEAEALSGIVNLLDTLQDDAAAIGRWTFPGEQEHPTAAGPPPVKRYYVEDDEGHHHGPVGDYEEAASVADAIDGRIVVREVTQPPAFPEEESAEGGA